MVNNFLIDSLIWYDSLMACIKHVCVKSILKHTRVCGVRAPLFLHQMDHKVLLLYFLTHHDAPTKEIS